MIQLNGRLIGLSMFLALATMTVAWTDSTYGQPPDKGDKAAAKDGKGMGDQDGMRPG